MEENIVQLIVGITGCLIIAYMVKSMFGCMKTHLVSESQDILPKESITIDFEKFRILPNPHLIERPKLHLPRTLSEGWFQYKTEKEIKSQQRKMTTKLRVLEVTLDTLRKYNLDTKQVSKEIKDVARINLQVRFYLLNLERKGKTHTKVKWIG